ncbi:MAG: RNA polymerase sigma-70 factor [Candidatus Paceibacterota bacterium]
MQSDRSENNLPISSQHMTEKQWVRKVREEGDREAFEKIFRNYYKKLHGFAYSYVGRSEDAEDILQTVFLRIWAQRESWDPPGTLKHYLFAAIRNEALNELRHKQVLDETEADVIQRFKELKEPIHSDIDSDVEDLRMAIQEGIDQLPSQCRQIFLLSRRSGLTYSEIADFLDISVNTVGTQMGRALKFLRKHLSDSMFLIAAANVSTKIIQSVFILLIIISFVIS